MFNTIYETIDGLSLHSTAWRKALQILFFIVQMKSRS